MDKSNKAQLNPTGNEDSGFGKSYKSEFGRMVLEDGTFNVERTGLLSRSWFHELIDMGWTGLLAGIFFFYLIVNLFFATLYYLAGPQGINGLVPGNFWDEFLQCYFFSVQSFTTVGYGGLHPTGFLSSFLAGVEALCGLLTFAIITGLVYSKFSQPGVKVLFSNNLLFAPYKEGQSIQLRLANAQKYQLMDVEANFIAAYLPKDSKVRVIRNLPLEIKRIAMFPLSWTLVHPLNDDSELRHFTEMDYRTLNFEFLVNISAYDVGTGRIVKILHSFDSHSFVFNAKFDPMFELKNERTYLHLKKINDFQFIH